MASSLSMVPPLWPKPRPAIMGTYKPVQATNGEIIIDVLSPTPPVLCLSTLALFKLEKSKVFPEYNIERTS